MTRPARPASRRGARAEPAPSSRAQAYRRLVNPFTPLTVFSADQVAAIHEGALLLLEQQGLRVLSPAACARYRAGGAEVDAADGRVRLDRGLVAESLASAPREITLFARDPARDVPLTFPHVAFGPSSGAPNITDLARGRRAGTLEDYRNGVRLCQHFEVMHLLGALTEPQDVPVAVRQLEMLRAQLVLSDKIPHVFCRGAAQVRDSFELIRLALGLDEETFRARPHTYTIINTNSPLVLDAPMADGIMDFAAAGQVQVITPFTLAGAMAPVTLAGALTLAHAETLGGLALAQLVRPGAPVVYGSFTSNVDMKSGSPAFGTPEYAKAQFGAGQLARHVGLPWRSSNATAANVADAQAAYESQMSLWGALMGGANFVLHAAGWVESGLSSSYEKFILDVEQLQMFAELFQPVGATAEDLALEAVAEVGPAGHFFGCAHTMARYRDAFYAPLVSDWRNFGAWETDGARTATERAALVCADVLGQFTPPPLDPAVGEALDAFVERRTAEGGSPPAT